MGQIPDVASFRKLMESAPVFNSPFPRTFPAAFRSRLTFRKKEDFSRFSAPDCPSSSAHIQGTPTGPFPKAQL